MSNEQKRPDMRHLWQGQVVEGASMSLDELRSALANIRTLEGLLPICASCKRIRDDKGYWNQIETYISRHSRAEFTHGICPECFARLYPDLAKKVISGDAPG